MGKIFEVVLNTNAGNLIINPDPIYIQSTDKILFRSGDGKEYTVIIDGAKSIFITNSNTYLFVVNPFNLCITDPAGSVQGQYTYAAYARDGGNVYKTTAPPKIILE